MIRVQALRFYLLLIEGGRLFQIFGPSTFYFLLTDFTWFGSATLRLRAV